MLMVLTWWQWRDGGGSDGGEAAAGRRWWCYSGCGGEAAGVRVVGGVAVVMVKMMVAGLMMNRVCDMNWKMTESGMMRVVERSDGCWPEFSPEMVMRRRKTNERRSVCGVSL
ncbi:hypothetical protein Tco_0194954 [Tanacetum coccineum]